MEIINTQEVTDELCANPEVANFFTRERIEQITVKMIDALNEVLGDEKVAEVTFHSDDQMFFDLNNNCIHIGLAGMLQRMIQTFFSIYSGGGSAYVYNETINDVIENALIAIAAHEAGHRVIDLNPLNCGISQEEWGQLGISSLANSVMDCRDNERIKKVHPDLKTPMDAAYEFCFGPGGNLDFGHYIDHRLKRGYPLRMGEFDGAIIHKWAHGVPYPNADSVVVEMLKKHGHILAEISTNPKFYPGKNPGKLEVKAKATAVYRAIAALHNGDYSKELVERDKENQKIHQSITLIALAENPSLPINEEFKRIIEDKKAELSGSLKSELEGAIEWQEEAKKEYDAKHPTAPKIQEKIHEAIKETSAGEVVPVNEKEEKNPQKNAPKVNEKETIKDYFDVLGPAVQIETLSTELREWLKKLFDELQKKSEQMQQDQLSEILKELMKDPEKLLKEIEDILNEKLRPNTIPVTVPSHKDLEGMAGKKLANPTDNKNAKIIPSSNGVVPISKPLTIDNREFREIEDWLDENFDMTEMIRRWQAAIKIVTKTGDRLTDEPTGSIDYQEYVADKRDSAAGIKTSRKYFIDDSERQHPMTLSLLWRTQNVKLQDSLKMALFLLRIYSAAGIRKYLNLELIVSQHVDVKSDEENPSPVPVIFSFNQDPNADYELILNNLKALNGAGGSSISIAQDATALRVQRERLLTRSRNNAFAIEFWDEAAFEAGSANPMQDVKNEIAKTQEALRGKAFCFVLGRQTPLGKNVVESYGEGRFLAEASTVNMLKYLDIVVRCMIQYKDNYSLKIKEMVKRELDIDL